MMARQLKTFVRIPVDSDDYTAYDQSDNRIQIQTVETFVTSQLMDQNPSKYQLIVPIEIPGMGFSTFYVAKNDNINTTSVKENSDTAEASAFPSKCSDCKLSNNLVTVNFDPNTGLVDSISDLTSDTHSKLSQNILWYQGSNDDMYGGQASGAYVFRPAPGTGAMNVSTNLTLQKIGKNGDYVQEMRQVFNSWVSQTVRLYQGKPYVEFEWTIGPIPFQDNKSREVIVRYDSDINNNKTFYTDANGRQIMTRILDYQPTYIYQDQEPVSGNYYPVNSRIYITDGDKQITILTDRSQGGSSLDEGSVELMVHRRDLWDDGFGVGEPLNETGVDGKGLVVTGRHWLLLSKASTGARRHRIFAQEMFHQPIYTFSATTDTFDDYSNKFRTSFSGITKSLPLNVNLLTLSQWKTATTLLLRLEHIFQQFEDEEFSRPVTVDIQNLFSSFKLEAMTEYSLTVLEMVDNTTTTDFSITLRPMQIRTFLIEIEKNAPGC